MLGPLDTAWTWYKACPSEQTLNDLLREMESMAEAVVGKVLRRKRPDIVNEALIAAYKAFPHFREEAQFSTWFYKIVENKCKKTAGKEGRRGLREIPLVDVPETWALDSTTTDIDELLRDLSPEDRSICEGKLLDKTDKDLAAELEISVKELRVRWLRLKRHLRRGKGGKHV